VNFVQAGIMPCATFRTVPFQYSSSHNSKICPLRTCRALVFSVADSNAMSLSTKWQQRKWRGLADRVSFSALQQMSDIQPVPFHNPPKLIHILLCVYRVKGVPIVQGAVPCQQHWPCQQHCHQVHAISGVEGAQTS
jgi:hypothetical protein